MTSRQLQLAMYSRCKINRIFLILGKNGRLSTVRITANGNKYKYMYVYIYMSRHKSLASCCQGSFQMVNYQSSRDVIWINVIDNAK